MSIVFLQGSVELLLLKPQEYRRVYTLDNELSLEYSHSDIVVCLKTASPPWSKLCRVSCLVGNTWSERVPLISPLIFV